MTQTSIGTGWMIPQQKRADDDAAFNQLIEQMDLGEVTRMMCPKSGGNINKCFECPGFRTCRPGQRAVRLTDELTRATAEKTAPQYTRKWTDKEPEKPAASANPGAQIAAEQEELRKACESGNAWYWMMENKGLSKNAAGDALTRLIRKFPGIAAEYGGSRRIMQRPKAVKIIPEGPVEAQDAQEQASAAIPEQGQAPEKEAEKQAVNGQEKQTAGKSAGTLALIRKGRERCQEAVESGDPIRFLMEKGASHKSAYERIRRWRKMYPDLFKGLTNVPRDNTEVNRERTEQAEALFRECIAQKDPAGYYAEKRGISRQSATNWLSHMRKKQRLKAEQEEKQEEQEAAEEHEREQEAEQDDEVSLEAFLSEFDFDEAEADQREAALWPEEPPEEKEPPKTGQNGAVNSDPMVEAMMGRFMELNAEAERLRAEKQRLEEQIKCVADQMEALELCISRFRK